MTDKENKWIKFYPSLELPKERVSIAYATHDERKIRYAYGYFQFHNGNCSSFWKDGNETPKVVKIEDIRYWMPVPSFDSMQEESGEIIDKYLYGKEPELVDDGDLPKEEPVSEDLEEAAKRYATEGDEISGLYIIDEEVDAFKAGANWQKEQLMAKAFDFTKEHNIACVLASECLRNHGWFRRESDFNDLFRHLSCVDKLFEGKFSGKTKVIVIKEN